MMKHGKKRQRHRTAAGQGTPCSLIYRSVGYLPSRGTPKACGAVREHASDQREPGACRKAPALPLVVGFARRFSHLVRV